MTQIKSKIMKKMDQVWVKLARCAGYGDMRRMRRSTQGAKKLLFGAENWARAAEYGARRRAAWRGPLRFLREVGFGTFLAGHS